MVGEASYAPEQDLVKAPYHLMEHCLAILVSQLIPMGDGPFWTLEHVFCVHSTWEQALCSAGSPHGNKCFWCLRT